MTILIIRIMFALGVVGYAVNMYCDRILSIFPNGTIKLDNIKEIEKDDRNKGAYCYRFRAACRSRRSHPMRHP